MVDTGEGVKYHLHSFFLCERSAGEGVGDGIPFAWCPLDLEVVGEDIGKPSVVNGFKFRLVQ